MIDSLFPCDVGALVTIPEAIRRLRTAGLIVSLSLGLLGHTAVSDAYGRSH